MSKKFVFQEYDWKYVGYPNTIHDACVYHVLLQNTYSNILIALKKCIFRCTQCWRAGFCNSYVNSHDDHHLLLLIFAQKSGKVKIEYFSNTSGSIKFLIAIMVLKQLLNIIFVLGINVYEIACGLIIKNWTGRWNLLNVISHY